MRRGPVARHRYRAQIHTYVHTSHPTPWDYTTCPQPCPHSRSTHHIHKPIHTHITSLSHSRSTPHIYIPYPHHCPHLQSIPHIHSPVPLEATSGSLTGSSQSRQALWMAHLPHGSAFIPAGATDTHPLQQGDQQGAPQQPVLQGPYMPVKPTGRMSEVR